MLLTLFFPMFPFDPPENIRKPKAFSCFQGDQKGTLERKGLNKALAAIFLPKYFLMILLHTRALYNLDKGNGDSVSGTKYTQDTAITLYQDMTPSKCFKLNKSCIELGKTFRKTKLYQEC